MAVPSICRPEFDRLARELSPVLLRYLRRCTGDRSTADDLLQETLLKMARGLDTFEGRASLKTWAFSIATRVIADHFRSPGRQQLLVDMSEAEDIADPELPISGRLIAEEMNACVREVINSLPVDYRAALVLHDLEDLPVLQVARICECSPGTAKIRIHRARRRLKAALQRQCDFYRDGESEFRCDRKPGKQL